MAQALTFIFAGLEPTASAMSFSLYELSRRPDLQLKIQNEVDAALERHGGAMTYQMMNELPYLDRVINGTYNTSESFGSLIVYIPKSVFNECRS